MDVFLLGAGKPASGSKPSALKNIALNTRALDWQINSFEAISESQNFHYLGGYYINEVIDSFPQLNFTVIPDWQNKSILHTFLKAPFTGESALVSYSDTIFRRKIIEEILLIDADVVYGVDTVWMERYESRTEEDIYAAEKISINNRDEPSETEFTGLMHFNKKAVALIQGLDESDVGSNLIDLLNYLEKKGLSIKPFDVAGHWAEFNSPKDIAQFILGTKAETLARLEPLLKKSHIGKQINFTVSQWKNDTTRILDEITDHFSGSNIVIRSSAKDEDNWYYSNAGGFESLLNIDINNRTSISEAINTVISSYGKKHNDENQILVQHFLHEVDFAGVVFTCSLETGAPYYKFNFDDKTHSTESVTSGNHDELRTITVNKSTPELLEKIEPKLMPVLLAIQELEQLLSFDKLDVEFAVDKTGNIHIFQVRPITVDHSKYEIEPESINNSLNDNVACYCKTQNTTNYVLGKSTLFANMPDWNPAEIIGTHPKPLAFSLYRYLITDEIWAQQRAEFGYRDVRPNPLIFSFSGQPYVDTRISLNSFIPDDLPEKSAEIIVNAYLNILSDNPHFHDKLEFEVAFTIWTPNFFQEASDRLKPYGVNNEDILLLEESLKLITCNALTRLNNDTQSIEKLKQRRKHIKSSNISNIDKTYSLINDCKRYGTLAFSHAARAGFITTTLLKSLVKENIISTEEELDFFRSISTVASEFELDKKLYCENKLSLEKLIDKYGHLRPGTYEVTTEAYWEKPSLYLYKDSKYENVQKSNFIFSHSVRNKLKTILNELGSSLSADELINYMIESIKAREYVKFEFSKNLSRALDFCIEFGKEINLDREEISYLEYSDIENIKLNIDSTYNIKNKIKYRKKNHALSCSIELPSLIKSENDFYCFERFSSQPNFITNNKVKTIITPILEHMLQGNLNGKLVLIPQADPGYDWIFGHNIAGLITQFGGANSHMAIRAAEMNLPAAIGVGEKLYEKLSKMKRVELDCKNHIIREIQ